LNLSIESNIAGLSNILSKSLIYYSDEEGMSSFDSFDLISIFFFNICYTGIEY
jgi:hypothetical protein